jgi:lipoprotein-anchoring transpeptidase ErfK/SrfK
MQPVNARDLWVQVLLDRAHFSPGEIDGSFGNVTSIALRKFQQARNLEQTGVADSATAQALRQDTAPVLVAYTIAYDDVRGPFAPMPRTIMEQAKLPAANFQSPLEALGEKFHCSPALLRSLNPNAKGLKPGEQIIVPNIHHDEPPKAASVEVSKSERMVTALDQNGKLLATYPATMGSQHDPLPIGDWKVTKVSWNPVFYYNPNLFWDAKKSDAKAIVQPGPNNPVGAVWIGLTKEHYGIHGTPEPGQIGHVQSHGCVRMTNWDAIELGQMVDAGTPVRFKE